MASSIRSVERRRQGRRRGVLASGSFTVLSALVVAVVLAWAWLFWLPMPEMAPQPLSIGYLLPAFAMWVVMMIAMMVPSTAPMILLHARIDRASSARLRAAHSLSFALAYLFVWAFFSALAALAQALLVRSGMVSAMELSVGNRGIAAGLVGLAALYELTAAKQLCLDQCQSPLLFMLKNFRPGAAGAFRLGLVHGLFCLGCCWALTLLLFVGGVMNLAWVAALGVVVLAEKFAPRGWRAERYLAAVLGFGAVVVLVA